MINTTMYRHMSSIDLDMFITRVVYRTPYYLKAKVYYYNRSAFMEENRLINHEPDTVKIKVCDLWKWNEV